jgi:hypothetical protein
MRELDFLVDFSIEIPNVEDEILIEAEQRTELSVFELTPMEIYDTYIDITSGSFSASSGIVSRYISSTYNLIYTH